jgi:hypothetical protein
MRKVGDTTEKLPLRAPFVCLGIDGDGSIVGAPELRLKRPGAMTRAATSLRRRDVSMGARIG